MTLIDTRRKHYADMARHYVECLTESYEHSSTEDLVDELQALVDTLANRGVHITFVFSSSSNRMELFDLNQGLHMRPDYKVEVPTEGSILERSESRD